MAHPAKAVKLVMPKCGVKPAGGDRGDQEKDLDFDNAALRAARPLLSEFEFIASAAGFYFKSAKFNGAWFSR